ncbi:transposable element gene, partial [Prunus dulcis]
KHEQSFAIKSCMVHGNSNGEAAAVGKESDLAGHHSSFFTRYCQLEYKRMGYDLFGHFDRTEVAPPRFVIVDEEGVTYEVTAAYKEWICIDKALLSLLIATLSDEAIEYVIGTKTARDAWLSLSDRYASIFRGRINHLKTELQMAQKGGDSIERFFLHLKTSKPQKLDWFLTLSSSSYASVNVIGPSNSGMGLLPTPPSLPVAYMGSYDRSVMPSLDRNSGSRHVLGNNGGFSRFNDHQHHGIANSQHGDFKAKPLLHLSQEIDLVPIFLRSAVVPECQICSKRGHTNANCYFCHEASSSRHGSQGQAPPSNLFAMTAQTSYMPDQVWIADSGASHHMDRVTKTILLKGRSNNGLYPIPSAVSSHCLSKKVALLGQHLSLPFGITDLAIQRMKWCNQWLKPLIFQFESLVFSLSSREDASASISLTYGDLPITNLLRSDGGGEFLSKDPSSLASDTQVSTSQSQSISSTPGSLSPIQHQASLDEQQLQAMFPFEVSDVSSSSVSTPDSLVSLFTINDHPMITRSKSGIVQNKEFPDYQGYFTYLHAIPELDEPSSFRVASFSSEWRQAMKEEIDALHVQDTWILVPSPGDKNIIGSKWVYKIKRNPDGSVGRYKARLVAQRFSQEPSFDFGETFSPVVRHTTVRLVLSIAAMNQWKLRQLDVKNAFLQGDLEEEVFMKQPPGFEDFTHPQFAPRAWNAKFTGYLPTLGFKSSHSDPSLFVQHTGNDVIILLRYVDNIIITGSSDQLIQRVVTNLSEVFEMKDMGQLTVFLGLQISYNSFGDIERTRPEFPKTRGKSCGIPDITSMSGLTY